MSDLITHAERQERRERRAALDRRIATAYMEALNANHAVRGGRVEIHLGEDVLEHLKAMAIKPDDNPPALAYGQEGFLFGFPIFGPDNLERDAIQVVVTVNIW